MLRIQYVKFRKKITFQKQQKHLFKTVLITPAPLTPAFINATHKNNADIGPAFYGPIRKIVLYSEYRLFFSN